MRVAAILAVVLSACAPKGGDVASLAAQNQALEARVAALEETVERISMVVDIPADPQREQEAYELATQARDAMDALDLATARDIVGRIMSEYADTTVGRAAEGIAGTLALVGTDADLDGVQGWIRGEHTVIAENTTLLVFFEAWCPHCQREVPVIEKTWTDLRAQGLDVVGITSLSRGTSDAAMESFLDESGVTFPVARDNGSLSTRFGAEGVPHAVLIRDGKIAWLGHPGTLSRAENPGALERFLPEK